MMTGDECAELVEAILDCWHDCNFAEKMRKELDNVQTLSEGQQSALHRIWDGMDDMKLEAGYAAGGWE